MDFACSVNTSMYATIWRTEKGNTAQHKGQDNASVEQPVSIISTEADGNF